MRTTASRKMKSPNTTTGKSDLEESSKSGKQSSGATLASLPPELLVEIIRYLDVEPVPYRWSVNDPFPKTYSSYSRINFLRALSQASQSLRSFCLPLLWDRIEVCTSGCEKRKEQEKELATELVRQLEITTVRDPSLAQYVTTVNVLITRFSIKGVIDELARCLVLFPHLHTLQILGDAGPALHYETAFKNVILPRVHTLFLPNVAATVIKCCPRVRRVIKMGPDWPLSGFDFIDRCGEIEELYGFDIDHRIDLGFFVSKFPATKVVNLLEHDLTEMFVDPNFRACISQLPALQCIRLELGPEFDETSAEHAVPEEHNILILSKQALEVSSQLFPPLSGSHKCFITVYHKRNNFRALHEVISGECSSDSLCSHYSWSRRM